MRKRFFKWASALSLLLSVAIVFGWIRGYWMTTDVAWTSKDQTTLISVSWGFGHVMFVFLTSDPIDDPPPPSPRFAVTSRPVAPNSLADFEQFWRSTHLHFRHFGFIYATRSSPGYEDYNLDTPFWFALLLSLILPAVSARRILRDHHRRRSGLCRECGYDLRASEGAWPECGTAIIRLSSRSLALNFEYDISWREPAYCSLLLPFGADGSMFPVSSA